MLQLNISLTTLAVILWSGMLIISGSIWVLASQVRKVADLLDRHASVAVGRPLTPAATHVLARTTSLRPLGDAQTRLDAVYNTKN